MLLIIDSAEKFSGTNTDFIQHLEPSITFSKMRLVFASICNSPTNTELYYIISISNIQIAVRGCNMSSKHGTFLVPTTSPPATRNIHQAESDFYSVANGENIQLDTLHVRIHHGGSNTAPDSGVNLIILELVE